MASFNLDCTTADIDTVTTYVFVIILWQVFQFLCLLRKQLSMKLTKCTSRYKIPIVRGSLEYVIAKKRLHVYKFLFICCGFKAKIS